MEDTSDTFALVDQTLAGKYRVERVVAKGGFGTVYYARHLELQMPVAVKVLMVPERFQGGLRAEFIDKFKLEARTIAALAHAATARVLDYGSERFASGEAPWMALEWVEGRTLEADLKARPAGYGRSPRETLALLRPAFDAVACAHAAGVAHRDLKPANLMIVRARRGELGLRLLDFGIAKIMEAGEEAGSGHTATQNEFSAFSLTHAAPEQISHARTGPWTDVHAFALIVVELLVGRRAYATGDAMTAFSAVLASERPTPLRLGCDVGPWEPVLARALALRPAERYADADALLAALDAALDPAEAAWQATHSREALLAETVLPGDAAAVDPKAVKPDTLGGASVRSQPPPRNRWIVPSGLSFALVLALVAVGVYTATRSDPPTASARPALAPVRPSPPPVAAPAPAPVAAPPVVPAAPVVAPVAPVDEVPPANHHGRHHGGRRELTTVAPAATPASPPAPTPVADLPTPRPATPTIVIE